MKLSTTHRVQSRERGESAYGSRFVPARFRRDLVATDALVKRMRHSYSLEVNEFVL
jgi:hypothetical protein